MRAVVVHGAGDLRVEERPDPTPRLGQVAIGVSYGGICGSDLHYYRHGAVGDFRLREPLVLGHEVSGHVLGGSGFEPGTPVTVHPATPCRSCPECAAGRPNICRRARYLGSAAHFPHVQGGFSDVLVVAADQVRPLPDGLAVRRAAVAEPTAVAWHAVRQAGDVRGRRVLVTGAGPIGCLVVAVLQAAGAAEIVVTDVHSRPLDVARAVGATHTFTVGEREEVEADVAIESSGSPAGFSTCLRSVRRGGTVVGLGLLPPGDAAIAANLIVTRELRVVGSFRFDGELDEVLPRLGGLAVDPVVTAVLPVARVAEAFELAGDPARSCKVLLDFVTMG
ncbi:L-idonate 5-dehydrogenase [Saccharothrix deserti]|uniref:L-idonate 5-dehydrogenase n=1 Tax=Saccharothrix deserti TaxID=2593674 RepID=UPI00131ECF18|nr:L-idonate 5-dehydrogenase [Saccharothrix deserti]